MAIDFGNDIVAGVVLIREDIESQNYEAGVSGWAIFANGDAEFNNGTFRGQLTAGSITAGTIGDSTIVNSEFIGGAINNSAIYLDDQGGGLILAYAVTQTVQTFTTSGTFVVPVGVTALKMECWAGGGGGWSAGVSGPGGGGGEYSCEPAHPVTPGETLTVTVGAGGAGGTVAGTGAGGNGGLSEISRQPSNFIFLRANGGPGAVSGSTTQGGTGSADSIHFNGGGSSSNNIAIDFHSKGGSGGGSSAGTSTSGAAGSKGSGTTAGIGGNGVNGAGNGGNGGNGTGANGTAGAAGAAPGGGGGAGGTGTSGSSAGGAGARGQVRITYVLGQQLVASLSPVAGTDSFGNSYPQGIDAIAVTEGGMSIRPKLVRKTVAQSVTSSTTPTNDNGLFVTLTPGQWRVELFLQWQGDTVASGVGDIQTNWTTTGSITSLARTVLGGGSNFVTAVEMPVRMQGAALGTPLGFQGNGTSTNSMREDLLLDVAATGVLQLQWAQLASSVVPTQVAVSSRMYVTKLS